MGPPRSLDVAQSFTELGATLEEQMKADSEHHTSLRKVVHDTMTSEELDEQHGVPREVCTATLSHVDKSVNDGGNQVRTAFLGELKRAFDDLTEVGPGLVGTTSWETSLTNDASWDEYCKHAEEKTVEGRRRESRAHRK